MMQVGVEHIYTSGTSTTGFPTVTQPTGQSHRNPNPFTSPPAPAEPVPAWIKWIENYWLKIIGGIVTVLVTAVGSVFYMFYVYNTQTSGLKERIIVLETKVVTAENSLNKAEGILEKIPELEKDIALVKQQVEMQK